MDCRNDINSLQEFAHFLYSFVKHHVDVKQKPLMMSFFDHNQNDICKALISYKRYEKINGEGFGSKTGFALMDWTDLNDKFLDLFKDDVVAER